MKLSNLLLLLFAFSSLTIHAQTDHLGSISNLPGHPRILMLKGEEDAIRKTISQDNTWQDMQSAILRESDRLITVAPVVKLEIVYMEAQ